MKIKLHAKLAAYSKVRSIESTLPSPTSSDAGKLLGINKAGEYALISDVADSAIDTLFNESNTVMQKRNATIDSLFKED